LRQTYTVQRQCQSYSASTSISHTTPCKRQPYNVSRTTVQYQPQSYRVSVNYDTSAIVSAASAAIVVQRQQQLATIAVLPPHATRSAPCFIFTKCYTGLIGLFYSP
jgi:hypothetical protein